MIRSVHEDYERIATQARIEAGLAYIKHGDLHSLHEGYGVLMEEVEELFDEIKNKNHDPGDVFKESLQVAAVAIRIAYLASGQQQKETNNEHTESASTEGNS